MFCEHWSECNFLSTIIKYAVVFGGPGDDFLTGGFSQDSLIGGPGEDHLIGRAGPDRLHGGPGNDISEGGFDNDDLAGGPGADREDDRQVEMFIHNHLLSSKPPRRAGSIR